MEDLLEGSNGSIQSIESDNSDKPVDPESLSDPTNQKMIENILADSPSPVQKKNKRKGEFPSEQANKRQRMDPVIRVERLDLDKLNATTLFSSPDNTLSLANTSNLSQ